MPSKVEAIKRKSRDLLACAAQNKPVVMFPRKRITDATWRSFQAA
jgi:hypothetical protein